MWPEPPLIYPTKIQKNSETTKHLAAYFLRNCKAFVFNSFNSLNSFNSSH